MKQTRKCKSQKCGAKASGRKYASPVRLQPVSTDLLGVKDDRSALLAENVNVIWMMVIGFNIWFETSKLPLQNWIALVPLHHAIEMATHPRELL